MKKFYTIALLLLLGCVLLACTRDNENTFYKGKTGQLQLQGVVLNVPNKSNLQLALFALDSDNKPKQLLATEQYKGNGNALAFQLNFYLDPALSFNALELRGRVTQAKKLIGYVTPWHKQQLTSQDLKGIILELAP
ncbi:hypothetical protein [Entomomonas asaccharolytica]|uniref:Lipoprotein n=1 Tax=Entomomonas asaccharolytica TaxID=2785331 RepID=A0A974RVX4_9GAMM|nr:hypothetical protein [Entomomonas asaccharolytica]QQP84588.1 hypothetical protein JHT90_09200 [Entomomonas asaccharolytica]